MNDAVVVQNLGKCFRRYHMDRPWTLHEALMRGFRKLKPAESLWGLRGVSFKVAPGRMVGVIGRNGAGKSTLLRLLGGVGRPDEGSVKVRGRVGALLNLGAGFHLDLTGRENLYINGVISGLTRREVRSRVDSIIAFSELGDYIDSPLRIYSTGMQMRLAFSIAIHTQPQILLIDEMLAVGDLSFQRKCIDQINRLKSEGCTIILVSHEAAMIQELCDEALWLSAGRLEARGPAESVVERYIAEADLESQQQTLEPHFQAPGGLQAREGRDDYCLDYPGMEITSVRLLDTLGMPTATIESGDPLSVEISYMAQQPIGSPHFQVFIHREDGAACCDMFTPESVPDQSLIQGEGQIVLHLEKLGLNGGLYFIDVGAYLRDWSAAYVYQTKAQSLNVRSTPTREAIFQPSHRWEVKGLELNRVPLTH